MQRGSTTAVSQRVDTDNGVGCESVNGKSIAQGFVTVPVGGFEIQREGQYPQFIVSASEAKIQAKIEANGLGDADHLFLYGTKRSVQWYLKRH